MAKCVLMVVAVLSPLGAWAQEQQDSLRSVSLDNIVVSASRLEENIERAPVSVEKMGLTAIRQSAAPSFFDAIENIRGVQMLTPSMGFRVINTRGFANTTNVRFVQMVDGMDIQAPHIGAPIANTMGPSDLDIQSVEIIPGVSSALYGMNAINGLANFSSKDPFTTQGFSFLQKTGVNRIGAEEGARPFSETSLRYAKALTSKLAIKINGTFTGGTDWVANSKQDLNPNANITTGLTGADNPAKDPVNSYGNESSNLRTLSLNGKNYVVARTGYYEKEVADYSLRNVKADGAVHYMIRSDIRLVYTYRYANTNNIYQRANRFRLDNYLQEQHGLSVVGPSYQLRTYLNIENTGDSYNARSMAENIDKTYKSDNQWFADYSNAYLGAAAAGNSIAQSHHLARDMADAGRPQPGTDTFNQLIDQLRNVNNWDYGAALRVKSRMFHIEGTWNATDQLLSNFRDKTGIDVMAGFDHRSYIIIPDGNYFINPTDPEKNLLYYKTGGFIQTSKTFLNRKLKVSATLRADKNQYYSLKWNPRLTAVFTPSDRHSIRISYQTGYRFPSIFEGFSNVNSGGVKRVGGFPVMSNGVFENGWLKNSIDAFKIAVTKDVNTAGLTTNQAIEKNKGILQKNTYTYVEPEFIQSFEVGYHGKLPGLGLQADVDLYYNRYNNFIGQVEMSVPKTTNQDSIPYYLYDKNKQDRYRLWTNSRTVAHNIGSSVSLLYKFTRNYFLKGNVTYATLQRKSSNDGLEDGFNTPQWMTNLSVGNDKLLGSLGFQVTYRWQSTYYWQSFLVNGNVPSYQTVDAQVSFLLNKVGVKVGGTNILNQYYYSFLGGPYIGGFYYCSVGFNLDNRN